MLFAIVAPIVAFSSAPPVQASAAALTGVWAGRHAVVNVNGLVTVDKTITLTCDNNGALHGLVGWLSSGDDDQFGNADDLGADTIVREHEEKVLGMADLATGELVLVERQETGQYTGQLLPDGSLHLKFAQSPPSNPVASVFTLQKTASALPVDPAELIANPEPTLVVVNRTCPDLSGSWVSPEYVAHKLDTASGKGVHIEMPGLSMTLTITMQTDASDCSFHGEHTWGNGASGGTEYLVGVVHDDGESYTMAEIPEHPEDGSTGIITGTVVFDGGKEEWVMHWHYVGISRTGSNGVVRRCAAQGHAAPAATARSTCCPSRAGVRHRPDATEVVGPLKLEARAPKAPRLHELTASGASPPSIGRHAPEGVKGGEPLHGESINRLPVVPVPSTTGSIPPGLFENPPPACQPC